MPHDGDQRVRRTTTRRTRRSRCRASSRPSWSLNKGWVNLATGPSLPRSGQARDRQRAEVRGRPATRACGGCHKGVLINEDKEAGLASFNSHAEMGGYTVENGKTSSGVDYVYKMIERMMKYYK